MRDDATEQLFSLLTSSDRAEAIAGDLMEERDRRGSIWFWMHVVRTLFALWRCAVNSAPLRIFMLVLAGFALLTAPALGGAAAVGLFPQLIGSPVSWITLSCFWWGGAVWTGASLVGIAPQRGVTAAVTLGAVVETLWIVIGMMARWSGLWRSELFVFYAIGLLVWAPLVVGGAVAHRRIASGFPVLDGRR